MNNASADLTNHLLVSTAVPQQENGVYVSPRRQGAGLVNAAAAISTPAYIDVDGKLVGKLELGDDPGWSGSYGLAPADTHFTHKVLISRIFRRNGGV